MSSAGIALVTGAASGIGKATVLRLVKQGWLVGAVDVDAQRLATAFPKMGKSIIPLAADITNADALSYCFYNFTQQVRSTRLDLLVNCAGLLYTGNFEDQPAEQVSRLLAVNNHGIALCCLAALPYLVKSAHVGRKPAVVNLSSASAAVGIPSMAVYSASKFWVKGFTEALAIEWSRFGIAVRDVMPPFVKTPMLAGRDENRFIQVLGVGLTPEAVADEVVEAAKGGPLHRRLTVQFKLACMLTWLSPGRLVRGVLALIGGYSTRGGV